MKHTCHSHIKRHSKSHSKPVMEGKKRDDLLPASKDCLQQGTKTQEEREKNIPCSQTLTL